MRTEPYGDKVESLAARPYAIELVREQDGRYVARVEELPGCVSDGTTPDEAVAMVEDAKRTWIWSALADGAEVPEPRSQARHSGRFVVRVGQDMHAAAVSAARRDGVSLNAWVAAAVALRLGTAAEPGRPEPRRAGDLGQPVVCREERSDGAQMRPPRVARTGR